MKASLRLQNLLGNLTQKEINCLDNFIDNESNTIVGMLSPQLEALENVGMATLVNAVYLTIKYRSKLTT